MKIHSLYCKKPFTRELLSSFPEIQAMDSYLLYGVEHLEFALEKAKNAMIRGDHISEDLFVEAILRTSGQGQIKKAFAMFGLKRSHEVVVFGEKIPLEELSRTLLAEDFTISIDTSRFNRIKQAFGINQEELASLPGHEHDVLKMLINERIAMTGFL